MFLPFILLSDTGTAYQISQNLLQVSGYNPTLNKLVLWMLVVTPLYGQILYRLVQCGLIFWTQNQICSRHQAPQPCIGDLIRS
jgi:hypothetical protein